MNFLNLKKLKISLIFCSLLFGTEVDTSFSIKWQNEPWGSGGLIPAGPPWSMVGPYDFDNDGYGDFIVSSSYSGEFCNGVYHYEAFDDDSISLNWVYTFWNLSCSYDNYSSVAVGDLDQDGLLEIIALVDTNPDSSGQHALQIFEWSTDSMSFLSTPTTTWNMGLDDVWESAQIMVEELDGDPNPEVIVSIMDGPWGGTGSSRLMIFELSDNNFENPSWNIEFEDPSWTNWSGYNISIGDLDQDGFKEIFTVAYEFYHIIIYENEAEDTYNYQTDFYVSDQAYERGNQSIIIVDINNDGVNEMFAVTSGVNDLSGNLLSPGYFYSVQGTDDVSTLSFSNFNLFGTYEGGLRQIKLGDADLDGNPNLYIAGHYNEALYDWEFVGGDPLLPENYMETIAFMDDTTDNFTPNNDQGKVRVAKLFSGDIDNDGNGDIVFSSGSFATDKPQLFMIEYEEEDLFVKNSENYITNEFKLNQNFPNPFNPKTTIKYSLNSPAQVNISIFNINGEDIFEVFSGPQKIGNYNVEWSGKDFNQKMVPSGIYLYRLKVNNKSITKKMILTK